MTNPSHETHDPVLIARFAADDVSAAERATAESLVASCADCASLAADIGAIMRATTTSLPPIHSSRDFRLTPEKARSLQRPRYLRWLPDLAGFSRALQPVAGTAVAVGLAMALVTSGSLSLAGPTSQAPAYATTVGAAAPAAAPTAAPAAVPVPAASAVGPFAAAGPVSSLAPAASAAAVYAAPPSPVTAPGATPHAGAQVEGSPRAAVNVASEAPSPQPLIAAAGPNGESQASGGGAAAGGGTSAQSVTGDQSGIVPGKAPASRQVAPAANEGIPASVIWLVVALGGALVLAGSWILDRRRRSA